MMVGMAMDTGLGLIGGPLGKLAAFGLKKLFEKWLKGWNEGRLKEAEGLIEAAEKMEDPKELQELIKHFGNFGTDARDLKEEAEKLLKEKKKQDSKGGDKKDAAKPEGARAGAAPPPPAAGKKPDDKKDPKDDKKEEGGVVAKVGGAAEHVSDAAEIAEIGGATVAMLSEVPNEVWEAFEHTFGKFLGPIGTIAEGIAVASEWAEYFQAMNKLKEMQGGKGGGKDAPKA
jgi:hypothetical protein